MKKANTEEASDVPQPTRRGLVRAAAEQLRRAGADVPFREAEWLLADVLGVGRAALHAGAEAPVEAALQARYEALVERRAAGEPLQYVMGHADFYGLRLRVTPAVLIPRPETEEVVEYALRRLGPASAPRVLDVGTGSGCIALAIRHERPDAYVEAWDVSAAALAVAQHNADALGLNVAFDQADVLALDEGALGRRESPGQRFDLLVSNPPYVPSPERETLSPTVRDHEPAAALFCGDDPLVFYRALVALGSRVLAADGHLVLEVHANYGRPVQALVEDDASYEAANVARDLAGHQRIVSGRRRAR